ncbi:hypothetical protein BJ684DRAFT_22371 [Piptocephalis cylindrospora]|uniref:Radical SAM core domain-containing protein n=1 Tax=Piptocephalis cylindrospora TaxID=1907219 RepID=A0A4P9Y9I1_9FUNG|nr:hypothetical protein BJ684DRAFT_22371 [Piptocephalis cylindrospora]|eukprot:RKP15081.1 hypothetical protein BJ684DRAFT_22371 [Piptocephalis cylindrospora]
MDAEEPYVSPLFDQHNRFHDYLRISLTERCNLRCTYCMPEEGVQLTPSEKLLSREEIERVARLFVSKGVRKIRLTGGEPTVRKDLLDIVESLAQLKSQGLESLAMTTNGIALRRTAEPLALAGLDTLNVSLDTLDPHKYVLMTRRKGLERVLENLERASSMGMQTVKINCVIIRGVNDTEVTDFVALTKTWPISVRFIEYMPFGGNRWEKRKLVPYKELLNRIEERFGKVEKILDDPNDTSKGFRVPGYAGTIGFISSMTNHFCGTCNRLRITADGNLKVCLFGDNEISLRDAMRSGMTDGQLHQLISDSVKRKKKQHAGMDARVMEEGGEYLLITPPHCHGPDQIGAYSNRLSHIDQHTGEAKMVDVGGKDITRRMARARARISLGVEAYRQVKENTNVKGDVLTVAKIAGIQAAKQTASLIPLCHPLALTKVDVACRLVWNEANEVEGKGLVIIDCMAQCTGPTGVEMEALTGATVAALTVFDMCKAVGRNMVIEHVSVLEKTGGKSGHFLPDDSDIERGNGSD